MTRHSPADYHFVVRPLTKISKAQWVIRLFLLQTIEMLVVAYMVKWVEFRHFKNIFNLLLKKKKCG